MAQVYCEFTMKPRQYLVLLLLLLLPILELVLCHVALASTCVFLEDLALVALHTLHVGISTWPLCQISAMQGWTMCGNVQTIVR